MLSLQDFYAPSERVFRSAPLDSGQGIVQLLGKFSDLSAGKLHIHIFITEQADRRNDCGGAAAEHFGEFALFVILDQFFHRDIAFGYLDTPAAEQLDDRFAGDAGKDAVRAV